jgi:hypothetical protein
LQFEKLPKAFFIIQEINKFEKILFKQKDQWNTVVGKFCHLAQKEIG